MTLLSLTICRWLPHLRASLFVAILALFYGIAFIFADFYRMPYEGVRDLFILSLQWFVVVGATFALLYLLALWRWIFAFTFPPLTILCTILAYFRYTVHVSFSATAIELAFVNDLRTSMEVITPLLIALVVLALLLSILLVWVRWRYIRFGRWYYHFAVAALLTAAFLIPDKLARPVLSRIPYNIFDAFATYFREQKVILEERPLFQKSGASAIDSLDVVLIIGESVRAKNLQLNGYQRATTPLLAQEKNVVSLPHIFSEYGFTHTSVPYMLTRADRKHPDRAYQERSFISIFQNDGYTTYWIANQEPVETYRYFMQEVDHLYYANRGRSVYSYSSWLDEDVLPYLDQALDNAHPKNLVLIHTIGSHWWYNAHFTSDFTHWTPLVRSRIFSSNTEEELINSYDNTILYSDHIWTQVINRLRHRCAILFYLSDHAENLGEDGLWGHGEDHEALHHPGCWIWYSDRYEKMFPQAVQHLRIHAERSYNSSFLFHSIIASGGIPSPYIESSQNLFSAP